MKSKMKLNLLEKVAKLYYEDEMTQEAVAQKLRISRPRVSRLLTEAKTEGIVQIVINSTNSLHQDLEHELERVTGLLDSVVVAVSDPEDPLVVSSELGMVAAQYFERVVQEGDLVGFTWGNTMSVMADYISSAVKFKDLTVMQMVGGFGDPLSDVHAGDIARRAAQSLNSKLVVMSAPGIVDSIAICEVLKKDKQINYALDMGPRVNVAFVGIGSFRKGALLMNNEEIITWQEIDPLIEKGAVGDIGLRIFDIYGNRIISEIDHRIIGVDLSVIQRLERVVGVAGGRQKYDAILGAVRGKFINTLVTDEETARRLVQDTRANTQK